MYENIIKETYFKGIFFKLSELKRYYNIILVQYASKVLTKQTRLICLSSSKALRQLTYLSQRPSFCIRHF